MKNLTKLTDEQIEDAFEDLGVGICADEVVLTHDTIDDFIEAAKNYRERGSIEREEKTLIINGVQVRKGDSRTELCVIDFGEIRGCYK